jgi:hypothetical protein
MTYDRRILNMMLRLEMSDSVAFHFTHSGSSTTCEFKDRDGKVVHTGTGVTEDAAFENAAQSWNPNQANDEKASLEKSNAELEAKVRDLESQLQTPPNAVATSATGNDSETDHSEPEAPVTKKKTRRRRSDSLGL